MMNLVNVVAAVTFATLELQSMGHVLAFDPPPIELDQWHEIFMGETHQYKL